jgi:hypothetical protein
MEYREGHLDRLEPMEIMSLLGGPILFSSSVPPLCQQQQHPLHRPGLAAEMGLAP